MSERAQPGSETMAALWREAVREERAAPAFLAREEGRWRAIGWREAGRAVDELAAGFLALGVRPGERVAILSRTRLEWTLCDWALISIGAVVVPIYATSSTHECAYVLGNSGARVAVCEDAGQRDKLAPARHELDALEQLILLDGEPERGDLTLADLRERGRTLLGAEPGAVEERRRLIVEDDVLTLVYTSGTTGPPKGCVLTHRNYRAAAEMVAAVEGLFEPDDVVLLHLPLAHAFARLVQFLGPITGYTIAHCPDTAGVVAALRDVRPTIFPSVPRFYEKLTGAIRASLEEARGPQRRLTQCALKVGRTAAARRQDGRRLSPVIATRLALADRLVLRRVRARLGGRLRIAVSGGSPLDPELAEFVDALGISLLEGYGLTECAAAATLNQPRRYRVGSVGLPLPGIELRIADDGEVLIRGADVFAGYYGDDEATRAVLSTDGWLASGDIGQLDEDGFLTITDRKKDIIVTPGGEKVSPQNLELALERSRLIAQALVVGESRPYLVALLALDHEAVARLKLTEAQARATVDQAVADVNRGRSRVEQIRRFAIVPHSFSEEAGELTPTLKPRRRVCEQHYRDEIDRLYEHD